MVERHIVLLCVQLPYWDKFSRKILFQNARKLIRKLRAEKGCAKINPRVIRIFINFLIREENHKSAISQPSGVTHPSHLFRSVDSGEHLTKSNQWQKFLTDKVVYYDSSDLTRCGSIGVREVCFVHFLTQNHKNLLHLCGPGVTTGLKKVLSPH